MTSRAAAAALAMALVFAAPASAPAAGNGIGPLVDRVLAAYGGKAALERAVAVRETGRVLSTMRGGRAGTLLRAFERPGRLRVEIAYPEETPEIRVLDGAQGWRDGKRSAGPPFAAMVLQAARLGLPLGLDANRAKLRDLGSAVEDGKPVRSLELPVGDGMTLTVGIDPDSGRIVRSAGRAPGGPGGAIEFVTLYDDFRTVDGVLFPFREVNVAMGQKTGDTILEKIETLPALPPGTFRP